MLALAHLGLQALLALAAYRLPPSVRPDRYRLHFTVVPKEGRFSGEESIAVSLASPTRTIDLHSVDLTLSQASVEQHGKTLTALITAHPENEAVTLTVPEELGAGAATVHLGFSAKLRDDLRGLYLAKNRSGEASAFTMFEATDARRAFPCFDEPAYRATYDISATIPQALTAISNAPEVATSAAGKGMHTITFAQTEPISSYLVALAVGRFKVLEGSASGKPIRVVAQPGEEQLGRFALSAAAAIVPWYERYFGVPYPYQKLDLVAVPDFESGAMENAGAIFFRDTRLLLDPHAASVQAEKEVALTVAHEIAHQWFGDLVTMAWWDDLWLNEAFATLMENKCVDALYPAYRIYDWVPLDTEKALRSDSLSATHPIHVAVQTAEEANAIFDEITYLKGSAVLRMLELFLTPEAFRAGLHAYFVAHARGNATEDDLWAALRQATGKDVTALARSWFDREGYPLVRATLRPKALDLTQRRFIASGAERTTASAPWQIPFCYRLGSADGGAITCDLLGTASSTVALPSTPLWFLGNADAVGFYRVAYAPQDLRALSLEKQGTLSAPERVSLLADAWALMLSGGGHVDGPLALIQGLSDERSFAVMSIGLRELEQIGSYLVAEPNAPKMRGYIDTLLEPTAKELGWEPRPRETPDREELRAVVLASLGNLADDPPTIAEARRRLSAYERGKTAALDASLLGAAIAIVAAHGDTATWDELHGRFVGAKTPEVRELYLDGLADFRERALVARTLELVRAGGVQKQDAGRVLGKLMENRFARRQAWDYITLNWAELQTRVTAQSHAWRFLPKLGAMCDQALADDVRAFFAKPEHHVEGSERPLQRALENIEICSRMRARESPAVNRWLADRTAANAEPPRTVAGPTHAGGHR